MYFCCIYIYCTYNFDMTRVHLLALGLLAVTGWTQAQTSMNTVFHPADSRGHADHGWLDTYHSFSFASWHNPERMHFGALRVLNDDAVTGGAGFGTHPHDNMEIVSIPLSGDLEHQDSMGNATVIREGDVQIMSAGTGIMHSEKNHNAGEDVRFLQIWVFPNERDLTPTYGQITMDLDDQRDKLQCVVSPDGSEGVQIHQNHGSTWAACRRAGKTATHCTGPDRACTPWCSRAKPRWADSPWDVETRWGFGTPNAWTLKPPTTRASS